MASPYLVKLKPTLALRVPSQLFSSPLLIMSRQPNIIRHLTKVSTKRLTQMGRYLGKSRDYIGRRKLKILKTYQYPQRDRKSCCMLEALHADWRMLQKRETEGTFKVLVLFYLLTWVMNHSCSFFFKLYICFIYVLFCRDDKVHSFKNNKKRK